MAFRLVPKRKVKRLERTVSLTTLKELINPDSVTSGSSLYADTTLFGGDLAHDVADKFNLLIKSLRG